MKKLFLSAIALMAVVSFSYAQTFEKGDNLLKVGIGLNAYVDPLSVSGIPFGASYEIGVSNSISIGVNVDYLNVTDLDFSALYYGVRGAYHANFDIPNLDIYAGAILGYKKLSIDGSGTYVGGILGATYYLGKSFGLFAELGATGVTNARVGLNLKF